MRWLLRIYDRQMKQILTAIFLLAAACVHAQVTVEATIDSIVMFIGEQVHVTVKATAPSQARVVFPTFHRRDTLTADVEVLEVGEERQEAVDGGLVERSRVYTLTSFEGKLYYLPPFKVKVDGKEHASKSLALKVLEMEVDTTKLDQFFPPKDVQDNPFDWEEWAVPFWLSVLLLALMAADGYLYVRLRQGKPVVTPRLKRVKLLLPHQKAMREIEEIKAGRMTGSEDQKLYYTKLTDTLRKYIQERYGFNAMEMTSTEIIGRLMREGDAKAMEELTALFRTADLVKFAKYSTLINENDMNLVTAIDFINSTKQDELPTERVVRPVVSDDDRREVKKRRSLSATICVATCVCALLFAYVAYRVFLLMV